MNNQSIKEHLKSIISNEPNTIKAVVAQETLDYHCPSAFLEDVTQHGCVSGVVTSLIYYTDTHKFFDDHYEEINDLRTDFEEETGILLKIEGDLKNYLAWFAFETVCYGLLSELE
ncbi:MAG: hypothetical protein WBG71_10430 [Leeuwenhoekiella sp.]